MIVVDVNVVCYLTMPGARTRAADRVRDRDAEWCVPILWRSEFRNVVAGQVRRGVLGLDEAAELVALAEAMLHGAEFSTESRAVLERAVRSGCTAYDCEYVALADELGVRLVTADRQVLAAFPELAVSIEDFAAGG